MAEKFTTFTCHDEVDATIFAYLGFTLRSTWYEPKTNKKYFTFDIPETTETCAGTVTNDPQKILDEWQDGEHVIGDGRELIRKFQSMLNLINHAKCKASEQQRQQPKKVTA